MYPSMIVPSISARQQLPVRFLSIKWGLTTDPLQISVYIFNCHILGQWVSPTQLGSQETTNVHYANSLVHLWRSWPHWWISLLKENFCLPQASLARSLQSPLVSLHCRAWCRLMWYDWNLLLWRMFHTVLLETPLTRTISQTLVCGFTAANANVPSAASDVTWETMPFTAKLSHLLQAHDVLLYRVSMRSRFQWTHSVNFLAASRRFPCAALNAKIISVIWSFECHACSCHVVPDKDSLLPECAQHNVSVQSFSWSQQVLICPQYIFPFTVCVNVVNTKLNIYHMNEWKTCSNKGIFYSLCKKASQLPKGIKCYS